jgi:hypothetical protein
MRVEQDQVRGLGGDEAEGARAAGRRDDVISRVAQHSLQHLQVRLLVIHDHDPRRG